jgi:hypothetical protein
MSKPLFISVNELKKKSVIDGNVDDDKILQFIEVAQDTHIQNYMGSSLYRKFQTLVSAYAADNNTGMGDADNSAYNTLWRTYVKPMLIWFAQDSFLPFAMFQITNGGVYKHSSETADTITIDELRVMQQQVRQNAEFYSRRFIDYICDNETDFPEYQTQDNDSDLYPDRDANYIGWVL